MKVYIQQILCILVGSIIIGLLFNYFRTNNIPIIAKSHNESSNSLQNNEYIIETIDLGLAINLYYDKITFVDARDSISYDDGHIPNAIRQTPYYDMVDKIVVDQGFSEPIVIYCDDDECGLSEDLAVKLQSEGFSVIYIFSGGWNQWFNENLPIE